MKKKSKSTAIQEAMAKLTKALAIEEPHIQVRIENGLYPESVEAKEFIAAFKEFSTAYKKLTGLDKIHINILL